MMAASTTSSGMAFLADIKGFDGKGTLKRVGTTVTTASGRRVRVGGVGVCFTLFSAV